MFEDATFESTGRIRTRSRSWMIATLALNSSILVGLILIPLVYPEALPSMAMAFLVQAPSPPPAPPPAVRSATQPSSSNLFDGQIFMPRQIPRSIATPSAPEPAGFTNVASLVGDSSTPGGAVDVFRAQPAPRVVHSEARGPARLTSSLAAGLLLHKVIPRYPALGKAMHVEGTVALAATISKEGNIVDLHVVSGPAVLQQAALDAVSQWRYRPYLLNGEPVPVETTIDVIFSLGR